MRTARRKPRRTRQTTDELSFSWIDFEASIDMQAQAKLSCAESILPLRTRYRAEANCQIVHDSIHQRKGWARSYLLDLGGVPVGFGSVAIGGPWKDKPTVFEFYVLPEHRSRAFEFFEVFLTACGARHFEVQTSDVLLTVMLHTYGPEIASEKIVFHDELTTSFPPNGGVLAPGNCRKRTTALSGAAARRRRVALGSRGDGGWEGRHTLPLQPALLRHLHGGDSGISKARAWLLPRSGIETRML